MIQDDFISKVLCFFGDFFRFNGYVQLVWKILEYYVFVFKDMNGIILLWDVV